MVFSKKPWLHLLGWALLPLDILDSPTSWRAPRSLGMSGRRHRRPRPWRRRRVKVWHWEGSLSQTAWALQARWGKRWNDENLEIGINWGCFCYVNGKNPQFFLSIPFGEGKGRVDFVEKCESGCAFFFGGRSDFENDKVILVAAMSSAKLRFCRFGWPWWI